MRTFLVEFNLGFVRKDIEIYARKNATRYVSNHVERYECQKMLLMSERMSEALSENVKRYVGKNATGFIKRYVRKRRKTYLVDCSQTCVK